MCFSLDYKTGKMQVIDGLQRMATIVQFLSGKDRDGKPWTLSSLEDIDNKISGKSTDFLRKESTQVNSIFNGIENLTIPITVLRCDYSKRSHLEFLFTIFYRLNTGGTNLNNQEIRNSIFNGSFNDLLHDLNRYSKWLRINKISSHKGYRFRHQEIILRMFTFSENYTDYSGRLSKYLNNYMEENKEQKSNWLSEKKDRFIRSVDLIFDKLYEGKIEQRLTVAVLEALLVAVCINIDFLETKSSKTIKNHFSKMVKHPDFSEEKLKEGLSGKQRVIGRLSAAEAIFAGKK